MKYTPPANGVQVSNNRVLIPFVSGYADGWIEGPPVLPRGPVARPKIRLPYHLWRQAISFLVDVFDDMECESQILFFKREDEWKLFCPEQIVTGSATDTPDVSQFNEASFQFLASNGYENVGSIHSHCKMSAFASGTDKTDEMEKCDGFHITIGKMHEDVLDYHLRSVVTIIGEEGEKAVRQSIPFFIDEFIDQTPNLSLVEDMNLPTRIRKQIIEWFYFNREDMVEFPVHWAERVSKKKYAVTSQATAWVQGKMVTTPQQPKTVWVQGKEFVVEEGGKLVEKEEEKKDWESKSDKYVEFWEAQAKLREEEDRLDEEEDEKLRKEVEEEYRKAYEDIAMHL